MAKAGIMGAGSWGTALALLLYKNGHEVTLWSINRDEVEELKKEREHKSKLPGVKIPEDLRIKTVWKKPLQGRILLFLQYLHHLSEAQREI